MNNKKPKINNDENEKKTMKKINTYEISYGIQVEHIPIDYTIEKFIDYFRHCGIIKKKSPQEYDCYF